MKVVLVVLVVLSMANTVLTQSQALVDSTLATLPNLVAYWPFSSTYGANDPRTSGTIDGTPSTTMTHVSGVYGTSNSAINVGSGSPNKHVAFESPSLDFIALHQSFTIAMWVKLSPGWQPFIEWVHPNNPPAGNVAGQVGMHMAQYPGTDNLWFNTMAPSGIEMNCSMSNWQFVAVTYNYATKTVSLFCNSDFHPANYVATSHPISSSKMHLGYSWSGGSVGTNDSFQCISLHSSVLDIFGLFATKDACKTFSLTCIPPCWNNGTCIGYNTCACTSGYTGSSCGSVAVNTAHANSEIAKWPDLIAYWPLSIDYGVSDAKPTSKINGTLSRPLLYQQSYLSKASSAIVPQLGHPLGHVTFSSPSVNVGTSSFTIAFFIYSMAQNFSPATVLEFYHPSNPPQGSEIKATHIAGINDTNNLRFSTVNTTESVKCLVNNAWKFVAFVFDADTMQLRIFCHTHFENSGVVSVGYPLTSNTLLLGYSIASNTVTSSIRYQCLSIHSAALNVQQMFSLRDSCGAFSSDWNCDDLPCLNGGTCIAQSTCSCTAIWTGVTCELLVIQEAHIQNLVIELPNLIAYWPMSRTYNPVRDIGPNQIHGTFQQPTNLRDIGPFGGQETSSETTSAIHFYEFEDERLALGQSSFTLAFWLRSGNSGTYQVMGEFFEINGTTFKGYTGLMQKSSNVLRMNFHNDTSVDNNCIFNGGWQYVAMVYSNVTLLYKIFCNANFTTNVKARNVTVLPIPGTTNRLIFGRRFTGSNTAPSHRYACISYHSAALDVDQLMKIKQFCRLFARQCSIACANGGSCFENNLCSCPAGFTGSHCETTLSRDIFETSIIDALPSIVAYWPLSAAYSLQDAKSANRLTLWFSNTMLHKPGPFGVANTAIVNGYIGRYFAATDAQLNLTNQSWTWAYWVNFAYLPTPFANMLRYIKTPSTDFLFQYYPSHNLCAGGFCRTCIIYSNWTFIAIVYDSVAQQMKHFCHVTWAGSPTNNVTFVNTILSNKIHMNANYAGVVGGSVEYACLSVHSAALSIDQILQVKKTCRYFSLQCSPPCYNGGTCVGYQLCECNVGWIGDMCESAFCDNPCQNGGTCTAPNVCTCLAGWSGLSCEQSVLYPLDELKAIALSLPVVVYSYWPLSSQFQMRDASPNLADGMAMGNGTLTQATGPYSIANSAYVTGNTTSPAFIKWSHNILNMGSDSWTLTAFITFDGQTGPRPILEWYVPNGPASMLWRGSGDNEVYFHPGPVAVTTNLSVCNYTNNWTFIAVVVSSTTLSWQTLCDTDFNIAQQALTVVPGTSNDLYAGRRENSIWGADDGKPVRISCVSAWRAALNITQLLTVKSMCPYVQSITCGPGCAPSSCRPRIDAPLGYLCDSCIIGWVGSDCSTATCTIPCSFNQFCVSPNTCACNRGWTGASCDQVLDYELALESVLEFIPTPVAYYPFNKDFGFHEALGTGLHAGFMPGVTYTQGPYGVNETAVETLNVDGGYIYFNYSEINLGSHSFTIALHANLLSATSAPLVDWPSAAHVWQFPDANTSYFSSSTPPGLAKASLPCSATTWQYIGAVFNVAGTCALWCDAQTTANVTCDTPLSTGSTALSGARLPSTFAKIRTACFGIYDVALTQTQLKYVKLLCQLFSNYDYCPDNCAPGACYGNLTSPTLFSCSSCDPAGLSGPQCDQSACNPDCSNGGSCIGANLCSCLAGWSGPTCETFIDAAAALSSLKPLLPNPIFYWPLNQNFGVREASGSGIDASFLYRELLSLVAGPDGVEKTAYEIASAGNGLIEVNNPAINIAASSFTLSLFVNGNGLNINRYVDFVNATATFLSIGHYPDSSTLNFVPSALNYSLSCSSNTWNFITFTYDSTNALCKFQCGASAKMTVNCPTAPKLANQMYIGARQYPPADPLLGFYRIKAACYSLYNSALSDKQLEYVKNQCQLYAHVCLPNCAREACYGNATSLSKFSCASCKPGWTGSDCSTPNCNPTCKNGGTCTGANKCTCTATFTGRNCAFTTNQMSAITSLITADTPSVRSYWPMNVDFALEDLAPDDPIDGSTQTEGISYANGPFGAANGAFLVDSGNYGVFESSLLDIGSANSFTYAAWVKFQMTGPLIEYFLMPYGAHLWHHPSDSIFGNTPGSISSASCPLNGVWQYVAFIYNNSTATLSVFCNNSLTGLVASTAPLTSSKLFIGYRQQGDNHALADIACVSFYSSALTQNELLLSKEHCRQFSCPLGCYNGGSCTGENNCVCMPGWVGLDCSSPATCAVPCQNGGNCTATDICTCAAGFTGRICGMAIAQLNAFLGKVSAETPSLLSYWPLTADYHFNDVEPTNPVTGYPFDANVLTFITGPFSNAFSAYATGGNNYVTLNSTFLDRAGSSFSVGLWVNLGLVSAMPIIEFYTLPHGASLWQSPTSNVLTVLSAVNFTTSCALFGQWQFVAFSFDSTSMEVSLFCNDAIKATMVAPSAAVTSSKAYIGHHEQGPNTATAYYACVSMYSSALSQADFLKAKDHCRMFAPINCTPACLNGGSCLGANLCSCVEGWTGPTCNVPICPNACLNGGSCFTPSNCDCPAGFTGKLCGTTTSQFSYILTKFSSEAPTLKSFWPLGADYDTIDIEPTNPVTGTSSVVTSSFTTGPYSKTLGAFSSLAPSVANIHFSSPHIDVSSNPFTIALWVKLGSNTLDPMPLFEYSDGTPALYYAANSLVVAAYSGFTSTTSCSMVNTWQFIAMTFDEASFSMQSFCNDTITSTTAGTQAASATSGAYIGYRVAATVIADAAFACAAFYGSVLTVNELRIARDHCKLFHVSCSQICQNGGTCVGYELCECAAGYTGPSCQHPVCSSPCQNGGSCASPNTCSCTMGFMGSDCSVVSACAPACMNGGSCNAAVCFCAPGFIGPRCGIASTQISDLQAAVGAMANLVAFWPLSSDFGLSDAMNTVNGTASAAMDYVSGPFNFDYTAIHTGGTRYVTFQSPNLNLNGSSFTISMHVNLLTGICPLFEYPTSDGNGLFYLWQHDADNKLLVSETSGQYYHNCTMVNTWQYIAVTYSATTKVLTTYCNGVSLSAITLPSNPAFNDKFYLGYRQSGAFVADAKFACLSILTQDLTSNEVADLKNLCQGIAGPCSPPCQNGGSCGGLNNCTCVAGWTGSTCNTPVCNTPCDNGGNCTGPNTCQCSSAWTGADCSISACSSPCQNGGTCIGINNCLCLSSWTGSACSTPICSPDCQNGGICTNPNSCTCTLQWNGTLCDFPICTINCQNGGTCSAPDVCSCQTGWTGSYCHTPTCSPSCENGNCTAPDLCSCEDGWNGTLCDVPICSPVCNNKGGMCIYPPDNCSCNAGWSDSTCSTPHCSQPCQNNGTCIEPDLCQCTGVWGGSVCNTISENATMAQILSLSDAELLTQIPPMGTQVQTLAFDIAANILEDFEEAKEMMTGLGAILDRFANMSSVTPEQFNDVAKICSEAADIIMAAATNSTEGVEQLSLGEGSMRCKIEADGSIGKEITKPNNSPGLTKEKLREIFNRFMGVLVKMFGNLRQILRPNMNMTFDGQFYGAVVFNMRFGDLPGYNLETHLAKALFPKVASPNELFENIPSSCPVLSNDDTVPVVLSAFIVNVLNIDQPFNMPTIALRVFCSPKVEVTLKKSLAVKVTAIPSVNKAEMFSRTKVNSQCDVSKTTCTRENANSIGSMASFPLTVNAGDFVLIFPVIEFSYSASIMLGQKSNATSFTWQINVTSSNFVISKNATFDEPRVNYDKKNDLRVLISGATFSKYLTLDNQYSSSNLRLNVYMKRDFSGFAGNELPPSACDLQRAYGYHLRIKLCQPDSLSNTSNSLGRRRREAGSDEGFELMPESNESSVVFNSKYFGDFGADLVISPNTIEFSYIFDNFATLLQDNAAVFAFQVVVVVAFFGGLFFAFRFDKIDLREWAFLPISSNKETQKYHYYVSVHYNKVKHFEMEPRVHIRLMGTVYSTPWRMLRDGVRKNYEGKHPENFILSVASPVGRIDSIHLMVESLKKDRIKQFQLHFDRIVVIDAQKATKFIFPAKTTMKATGESVRVELACEDELKGYTYLISGHSKTGVTDIHPWLSIAKRPLPSNWTRVERLACVVSALFMAMLVNAMFYGREADSPSVGVKVGNFFTLSWFTLWTSFIGAVIVIPPTAVIAFIFKKVDRRSALISQYLTSLNMKLPEAKPPLELLADGSAKKTKKPLKLPFKCVIIAWFLVAACVGVSTFLCIMYSLQWGRDKSLAWLSGMFLNIIQDIILIQPIKVVLTAIVSATMHSLPDDGVGIGFLIYNRKNNRRNVELFKRLRGVIVGICHHIIYVFIFGVVIATTTNRYSYIQVRTLRQYVEPLHLLTDQVKGTLVDYSQVFHFLRDQLVPNLLNGNQLEYGNYYTTAGQMYGRINPHVSLLGPIQIRQQRVTPTACPLKASVVPSYVGKYSGFTFKTVDCQKPFTNAIGQGESSEKRSFNLNWQSPIQNGNFAEWSDQHLPWTYRETSGISYSGWEAFYAKGGYWFDLSRNMTEARQTLAVLRDSRWLDNSTSVIFVDFILFNIQTNLFIAYKIVFEALDAGGLTYHARMLPLQLYQYSGASSMLVFAVQGLWALALISHVFRLGVAMKRSGGVKKFFKNDSWNILDAIQILMGFVIVALFAVRIVYVINQVTKIQTMRSQYVNLDFMASFEDLLFNIYGLTFFMTLMLFFRHLKFNKHWCIFIASLSRGRAALATYSAIFMISIILFAAIAYLIMGQQAWAYSSFTRACLNLVQGLIGVVDYQSLTFSRFYLALVMLFSSVVLFIGANIFVTIIMVAYADVTSDVAAATDWDADLSDFISTQLKSIGKKKIYTTKLSGDQTKPQTPPFKPIGEGQCAKLEEKMLAVDRLVQEKLHKIVVEDHNSEDEDDKLMRSILIQASDDMTTFQPLLLRLIGQALAGDENAKNELQKRRLMMLPDEGDDEEDYSKAFNNELLEFLKSNSDGQNLMNQQKPTKQKELEFEVAASSQTSKGFNLLEDVIIASSVRKDYRNELYSASSKLKGNETRRLSSVERGKATAMKSETDGLIGFTPTGEGVKKAWAEDN